MHCLKNLTRRQGKGSNPPRRWSTGLPSLYQQLLSFAFVASDIAPLFPLVLVPVVLALSVPPGGIFVSISFP